ncbi:hypothetical protein AX14_007446 [Amanita brunnescens Koide BX004]|nr:hypothetical protein AX14_007446 [Amanita brunnescens Koide BX004]
MGYKNQDDILVAIMGPTGSGKSSIVNVITRKNSVAIGNTLESETSDIQVVRFSDPDSGRTLTIVDTPGFDDSRDGITDTEILKRITKFLLQVYDENRKLNALIYVQRISDPRFGGQSARNLRMFRNLCGEGGFKNVVVLTTFWDKVTNEEGRQREQQLKSQYFKELVQGGARFMQHDRSLLSAQEVLMHVLTLVPTNVRIQEEIRVDGKNLGDTAAGSVHRMEVEALITKHRKELDELKAEMDEVKNTNAALARELKEEQDEMQQKLKVWESERNELKMDLDKSKMTVEQLKADVGAQKNQGITD